MAKMNKYDRQHWNNQAAYERQVDAIYRAAAKEAAALGVSIRDFNPDRLFSFSDYPTTRKKIEKLLSDLQTGIMAVIVNGIRSEWTLANQKNDELARQVFGDNVGKLTKEQERRYFSTNGAARDAFIKRKADGLGLSDRVWKYTNQFKDEIELGLDIGIRSGRSADELSRDLRSYLQHPDKLFRRVRNKHGQLVLSRRAKAYHPGRGVYRSSYKNARRLAATETNMAYRTADHERWQQLDFVVGIEIRLSGNHPVRDICDDLKGRYPKDFKFTGWHPHCRCHVVSILKTEEELDEDTRRILAGEKPAGESVNRVMDVPEGFKDWIRDNGGRISRAKSLPYFIKDNKAVVDVILHAGERKLTTREKAKLRHNSRTPEQVDEIKRQYWMRFESDELTQEQKIANINAYLGLERQLKIKRGRPMTYNQADHGRENPYHAEGSNFRNGYLNNCQTCTMAHLLRRKGFNVSAMPNKITQIIKNGKVVGERQSTYEYLDKVGVDWMQRFVSPDESPVKYSSILSWAVKKGISRISKLSVKQVKEFLKDTMQDDGIYEVYCGWKRGSAHVFCAEVTNGKIKLFDPQTGKSDVSNYIQSMNAASVMCARIDLAHINELIGARLFAR